MGKLTTYFIMMVGLMGLFYFTGLTTDCENTDGSTCVGTEDCLCKGRTPSSIILNWILKPENIEGTSIWSNIALLLAGITALGLSFIAALALRDAKLALLGPFAIFLLTILADFNKVVIKIWSIHPLLSVMIALILSPLLIYYVIAIVEWWSGSD